MQAALNLVIIGTEEEPRWTSRVEFQNVFRPYSRWCCREGHLTPEIAAQHGAEQAAAALVREVRALKEPAYGAAVIAKLEAA